jgi:hypothetical protein
MLGDFSCRMTNMSEIRVRRKIESETIHLPELKPLLGKTVEIIVLEEAASEAGSPDRWQPLINAAAKDLVDPEVYKKYRDFDQRPTNPTAP